MPKCPICEKLDWRCANPDVNNASLEDIFDATKRYGPVVVFGAFQAVRQVQEKKHHDACLRSTIKCKLDNDTGALSNISTEHKRRRDA